MNGIESWSVYLHSNMDRLKPAIVFFSLKPTIDLHSNMDRLKRSFAMLFDKTSTHLHSNMDRLKRIQNVVRCAADYIYIPIWID